MFARRRSIEDVYTLLQKLEFALITREAKLAADAYEGLRKQVAFAADQYQRHISDLQRLHRTVFKGGTIDAVGEHVSDMLTAAGVAAITDVGALDAGYKEVAFDVVEGSGERWEVLEPAYVSRGERPMVLQRGKVRASSGPEYVSEPPPEAVVSGEAGQSSEGE